MKKSHRGRHYSVPFEAHNGSFLDAQHIQKWSDHSVWDLLLGRKKQDAADKQVSTFRFRNFKAISMIEEWKVGCEAEIKHDDTCMRRHQPLRRMVARIEGG